MPRLKGLGVRRKLPFSLRLNNDEKAKLERWSIAAHLSMVEFARCKIFNIPFDMVGGKKTVHSPRVSRNGTEATEATEATD